MLYHLYDMQHAAMRPMRFWAEAAQQTFQNPLVPLSYTKLGRTVAAGAELMERTTRRFAKPSFGLKETTVQGQTVAITERIVTATPFCNLLNFAKPEGTPRQPRVLLVAPMSGHHATLLRGTVEALIQDHDVFITDWIDARLVPGAKGRFDLDDYIETVAGLVRFLGERTHIVAVCQPAVPVMAAVSLMAAANEPVQARSMTLMGGPIDPMANPTTPVKLAVERPLKWFERSVITTVPVYYPGAFRRVYPGFIQLSGFMSMNLDRHIGEHIGLFRHLVRGDGDSAEQHRRFYDEYLSVMDPGGILPANHRDGVPEARPAEWNLGVARAQGRSGGDHQDGGDDGGRRVGRHLRPRPDHRGAAALLVPAGQHAQDAFPEGRRPLRHLQRPPLARKHPAGNPQLHPKPRRGVRGWGLSASTAPSLPLRGSLPPPPLAVEGKRAAVPSPASAGEG